MPLSELHKQKRGKNFAILAALIVFIVTVFAVSIIRMKGG